MTAFCGSQKYMTVSKTDLGQSGKRKVLWSYKLWQAEHSQSREVLLPPEPSTQHEGLAKAGEISRDATSTTSHYGVSVLSSSLIVSSDSEELTRHQQNLRIEGRDRQNVVRYCPATF